MSKPASWSAWALVLLLALSVAVAAADRRALDQFLSSVKAASDEGQAVHAEVQRRLQQAQRPRRSLERIEVQLEALREANRQLATLEARVAAVDRLDVPAAFRDARTHLLLACQQALVEARNLQLFYISGHPEYLEWARAHGRAADEAFAAWRAHVEKLGREVSP